MGVTSFLAKWGLVVNGALLVANASTQRVGVNTASPVVTFVVSANDAMQVPVGNTAQRPAAVNAYFRYNPDISAFEGVANNAWGPIGGGVVLAGSNTFIQYNNSGALGACSNFTFSTTGNILNIPNIQAPGVQDFIITSSNTTAANIGSITVSNAGFILLSGNTTANIAQADATGFRVQKQRNQTVGFAAGGTTTIDCANGNIMTMSMTGNTIMGAPNNPQPGFYTLFVEQDAIGGRTITSWNSKFKWPGATVPQQTTTPNAIDIYSLVCDGTNFYGSIVPNLG